MIQSPNKPSNPYQEQELLFNRQDLNQIGERFHTYIMQCHMMPGLAWMQAVEDQVELIRYKLELMQEGAMAWDWSAIQLDALRVGLELMVDHEAVTG
jgi:hypothetical protein